MEHEKGLENLFNEAFTPEQQVALIRCLFDSYNQAFDACKVFQKEEAHDLLPFYRWVQLRAILRGLGGRFGGIQATIEPNGTSSSYHVALRSGRVMLTVSSVDRPGAMPRLAQYRREYALESQLDLFREIPKNTTIYALLIHGSDKSDRKKPAFAQIGFPAVGFSSYIHKIDLFDRFNATIGDITSTPDLAVNEATLKQVLPQIKKASGESI